MGWASPSSSGTGVRDVEYPPSTKALAVFVLVLATLICFWLVQRTTPEILPPLLASRVDTGDANATKPSQPEARETDQGGGPHASELVPNVPNERLEASAPEDKGPTMRIRVTCKRLAFSYERPKRAPPISSAVEFELGIKVFGGESFPLYAGRTDEEGTVIVDLPWSAITNLAGSRSARLWGVVREHGYQQRVNSIRLPILEPSPEKLNRLELKLDLRQGVTLNGTLLDTQGVPCSGTIFGELIGGQGRRRQDGSNTAQDDGKFALHLEHPGLHQFFAERRESPNPGSACSGSIDIDLNGPQQDLELHLVGPGSIHGVVLDSGGLPTPGLDLLALTAKESPHGAFSLPVGVSRAYTLEGRGFHLRQTRTDARGQFLFSGLRNDNFVVRARTRLGDDYPIFLTATPVVSNGQNLVLRLSRPHLIVKVLDAAHEPIKVHCPRRSFEQWPKHPTLQVLPAPEWNHLYSSSQRLQPGKEVSTGTVVFDLPTEQEFIVSLFAPGQAVQSARVFLPNGCGRVDQVFVLDQVKPPGELLLQVRDPEGKPVNQSLLVDVIDPISGITVVSRASHGTRKGQAAWPARFALPKGIYRVEVTSTPGVESHHGTVLSHRRWGDFRAEVAIASGETKELTANLSAPAWIDLEVLGETNEGDRVSALEHNPGFLQSYEVLLRAEGTDHWSGPSMEDNGWTRVTLEGDERESRIATYASRVTAQLWREDGYPIDVDFSWRSMEGSSAAGTHMFKYMPLGTRKKSEALPPGNYRLVVRLPGGRSRSREVVLTAGGVVEVSIDFGSE